MKRKLLRVLIFIGAAALYVLPVCAKGIEHSEQYDYPNHKAVISGTVAKPDGFVMITVLDKDKAPDFAAYEKSEDKDGCVLFRDQVEVKDGKFSITVSYNPEDSSNFSGNYKTALVSTGGEDRTEFDLALVNSDDMKNAVFFEDMEGNTAALGDGAVSPLISNIKIDFGVEMPEPNEKEGISLSGGGQDIDFTLKKASDSGSVWIMTLGSILMSETNYTLAFPDKITGTNGVTLDTGNRNISFDTAKLVSPYQVLDIEKNGQTVSSLNVIGSGDVIKINTEAINTDAETANLLWILAYYDGANRLLGADSAKASLPSRSILSKDKMPTLTLNVPQNAESAKLFLWNKNSLISYDDVTVLEKYGIIADFGETDIISNINVRSTNGSAYYNGRYGRLIPNTNSDGKSPYLYCNVNDSVMNNISDDTPIDIEVEYFDGDTGCFSLQYDSHHPDTGLEPKNPLLQQSEIVYLEGTQTWRTKVFHLEDMRMGNGVAKNDFRIGLYNYRGVGFSPAEIVFGSVRVKESRSSRIIKYSTSTDKLGNIFAEGDDVLLHRSITNKSDLALCVKYVTEISNKLTGESVEKFSEESDIKAGETITKDLNVPSAGNSIFDVRTTLTYYPSGKPDNAETDTYDDEYAVSVKLAKGEGDSGFGYQTQINSLGRGKNEEVAELLSQIGASWNRDGIMWNTVETKKGVLKLPEGVKEKLTYQKEHGVNNLLICSKYNSLYDEGKTPTSEEAINAFANYCGFLARELKGIVDCFEIWNEYNITSFNNNPDAGPEQYAKLLKAAYQAIKAENPKATVVGLGMAGVDINWAERVFDAGGLDYCDAVSCHPYDWSASFNEATLKNNMNKLKDSMVKRGKEKPIWITEVGFSTVSRPPETKPNYACYTQKEQASAIVLANAIIKADKLSDKVLGYCLYDRNNQNDLESCWGLLNYWAASYDGKPKNGAKVSYLAAAAMNKFIGDHNSEYISKKEYKDELLSKTIGITYAIRFNNKTLGKDALLLQASSSKKSVAEKTYALGCNSVDIYDMYGNLKETLSAQDGNYTITALTEPRYVVGNFTEFE